MKLSALDIRKQEFARTFRGYDPEEVESFLQVVATGWQELVDDLRRAQDKINEQQLKLEHYMKVEEALEEALQTARSSARQTIESAERKAADMLQEAENRIVSLQREADTNRLEVKRETARYAVRQQEIVAKLRSFLVSEMEMLRHYETDTGERTLAAGGPRKEIEMFREVVAGQPMAATPSDKELRDETWGAETAEEDTTEAKDAWSDDGHASDTESTEAGDDAVASSEDEEEDWDEEEWEDDEDDEDDEEGEEDWDDDEEDEDEDDLDDEDDEEDWDDDEGDDDDDDYDEEEEDDLRDASPGWKVTPVFESAGDEEDEDRPIRQDGSRLPEDSADDEIRKIHEILKGLDEEQDADDR
ncbi:MAG: DivIVA domain-containing protein [Bacteroidetes bacterium]|nr:DivIVA domain-containing protein [Bacteroidota bacterium]